MIERTPRLARIDNLFVEKYVLRERLCALLDSIPSNAPLGLSDVRDLRKRVRRLGPGAIQELIRVYLEEQGQRGETAFVILGDFPERVLRPVISNALTDPKLSKQDKIKLLAVSAFESGHDYDTQQALDSIGAQPGELMQAFTSAVGEMLEREEIGVMWLRDFWAQPRDDKLALLAFFVEQANPQFLPALELEARSPYPQVRGLVARGVRRFAWAEALDLATALTEDRDPAVRYDAHLTLESLENEKNLPPFAPVPRFESCYCAADPEHGMASLLYAARDARDRLKFCSLLLDTWSRGIVDVWGNIGVTPEYFEEVVANFNRAAGAAPGTKDLPFTKISNGYALHLIRETLGVSHRRKRRIPMEFYVWESLFRHENADFAGNESPFLFDLVCAGCRRAINPNRARTNVEVSGKTALCSKCRRG